MKIGKQDATYQLERFSKTQAEFDEHYEKDLQPIAEKLEEERQKTMSLAKEQAKKLIIPALVALAMIIFFDGFRIYVIAALAAYGAYLFKDVYEQRKKMRVKIKEQLLTALIQFLNPNFTYKPKSYVHRNQFIKSNIFKDDPNRYSGDDLIKGFVGNDDVDANGIKGTKTELSFSEIKAEKVEKYKDKNGKTQERVTTIFQGMIFVVDFNKDFEGLTTVVPKQKGLKISLPRFLSGEKGRRLEEVELEDMEFMDKFTVRTTDQIKARYILTPGFMRRLYEFATKKREVQPQDTQKPETLKEAVKVGLNVGGDQRRASQDTRNVAYFSFRDGKMYFLLSTGKEHFESGLLTPINKSLVQEYYEDINKSLELVDELNLNLRIWSKE
jgi:DNA-binding LytR/AlgR family response regulator